MNRDDIIRMAREATDEPCPYDNGGVTWSFTEPELERFAALVAAAAAAAEREAYQNVHRLLEVHQAALEASEKPGPWPAKEVIAKAVAEEREACAQMCEAYMAEGIGREMARAIRARGEGLVRKTHQFSNKTIRAMGEP